MSGVTITINGEKADSNIIIGSNDATLNDTRADLTPYTANIATNIANITTNTANIATNTADISNIKNIEIPVLKMKDSNLNTKDLEITDGLNSFFRYYSNLVDLSAGVLTSSYVYPPI